MNTKNSLFNEMLQLEKSINALYKKFNDEFKLHAIETNEAFEEWHSAECLLRSLTEIKCALGNTLKHIEILNKLPF